MFLLAKSDIKEANEGLEECILKKFETMENDKLKVKKYYYFKNFFFLIIICFLIWKDCLFRDLWQMFKENCTIKRPM